MQLTRLPLSVSRHESHSVSKDNLIDARQLKNNFEEFRREMEMQIKKMTDDHASEIKKLYGRLQQQAKIIKAYEQKYGRLEGLENRKENMTSSSQSPKKIDNMSKSKVLSQFNESPLRSTKRVSEQLGLVLSSQDFMQSPPDELYKSRYEQLSRMRKSNDRGVYESLKHIKESVEKNTSKLLQLVGQAPPKKDQQVEIEIQKRETVKRVKQPDEQLNTSLSFICDSLERSKEKRKKKVVSPTKSQRKIENPELEKRKESKDRLNFVLREMRDRIEPKKDSPKKQSIKTSKLLTTGHPGTSKVLINPVPMDLERKQSKGVESPTIRNASNSILKNSSDGRFSKTIEGLSEISKVTRQSSPSKIQF